MVTTTTVTGYKDDSCNFPNNNFSLIHRCNWRYSKLTKILSYKLHVRNVRRQLSSYPYTIVHAGACRRWLRGPTCIGGACTRKFTQHYIDYTCRYISMPHARHQLYSYRQPRSRPQMRFSSHKVCDLVYKQIFKRKRRKIRVSSGPNVNGENCQGHQHLFSGEQLQKCKCEFNWYAYGQFSVRMHRAFFVEIVRTWCVFCQEKSKELKITLILLKLVRTG